MNAAKVRNLQSQLMVAALECSNSGLSGDRLYDRFVSTNRNALTGFNDSIKLYFVRAYGEAEGRRAYDHFTTALANRQATRAATTDGFCRSADTLMRLALDARPTELIALANDVEERPFGVGATCDEARDLRADSPAPSSNIALANPEPMPAPEPIYAPEPRYADADTRRSYDAVDTDAARAEPARYDPPLSAPLPASAPIVAASVPIAVPAVAVVAPAPAPIAAPVVAVAAATPIPVKVVKIASSPRATPAEALAAAVQALQAATEALKASAVATPVAAEVPVDAAPVIHERATPARRS